VIDVLAEEFSLEEDDVLAGALISARALVAQGLLDPN
jgi:hypothetical protein